MKLPLLMGTFLISLSFPALAGLCELSFGSLDYESALRQSAKKQLNRDISQQELEAIDRANQISKVEDAEKPVEVILKKKVRILQTAGFSEQEIGPLMESGIVWVHHVYMREALLRSIQKGKNMFIVRDLEPESLLIDSVQTKEKVKGDLVEVQPIERLYTNGDLSPYIGNQYNILHMKEHEILHPDTAILFESAKLRKRKVSHEDLKLSSSTEEEAKLKKAGYGPVWTKGIDKLNAWIELKQRLQDLRANPWTSHIEYFADQVKEHIAWIKAGSDNMDKGQKGALADLEQKAKQAILNEKVTYSWWLWFHFELSALVSNDPIKESSEYDRLLRRYSRITVQFPLRIAIPTTLGELGIITLNRALSESIYPLGLISHSKRVHVHTLSPLLFISHDLGHADILAGQDRERHALGHRLRHKKMQALMNNMHGVQRKRAELFYFLASHEQRSDILLKYSRKSIARELADVFHHFSKDHPMADLGLETANIHGPIEDFMREVYDPAF